MPCDPVHPNFFARRPQLTPQEIVSLQRLTRFSMKDEFVWLNAVRAKPCKSLARLATERDEPHTSLRFRRELVRSEEHTSELQSRLHLVCRLLLEKKKNNHTSYIPYQLLHPRSRPLCLAPRLPPLVPVVRLPLLPSRSASLHPTPSHLLPTAALHA